MSETWLLYIEILPVFIISLFEYKPERHHIIQVVFLLVASIKKVILLIEVFNCEAVVIQTKESFHDLF